MAALRILSHQAAEVTGDIVARLNGLPMDEGIGVLISILAATLNRQAGDAQDVLMLHSAVCDDLRTTMLLGWNGELEEGSLQ